MANRDDDALPNHALTLVIHLRDAQDHVHAAQDALAADRRLSADDQFARKLRQIATDLSNLTVRAVVNS